MAEERNFKTTVEALFKGMDGVITSKTVVGDAIKVNDIVLIPLIDVSFGMGAGYLDGDKKGRGTGGMGGKISPSAVLVIKDGVTRLVNIKNQDTMTKILDLIPNIVDKFTEKKEDKVTEDDVADILNSKEE